MRTSRSALFRGVALAGAAVMTTLGCSAAAPPGTDRARTAATHASPTQTCPQRALSGMSLEQRVGQLFVAGVSSTEPTAEQQQMIAEHHLGGVILMGHSSAGVAATRQVSEELQSHASADGVRLWVTADQEGGYVQVLKGPGFSEIPTALEQGELDPGTLRSRARQWGTELRDAGVNLNLAPVLDTVPAELGRDNKPIGYYYREYGHTPETVTTHGMAFKRGMQNADVQATAKHFPGLGRVLGNTDTNPRVVDDVTTRDDPYLRPFQAAADDRIPIIMMSSAYYTKIDPESPAVFSKTIMNGMLRRDLGFTGVIMSDDLGNAAAVQDVPVGERATRFLDAGGTVVLTVNAATIPKMSSAVLKRAHSDPEFRDKVDAAALKVLRAKNRNGLLPC